MKNPTTSLTKLLILNLQAIDSGVIAWLSLQRALVEFGSGGNGEILFVEPEAIIKSHCRIIQEFIRSRKNDLSDSDIEWLLKTVFAQILGRVRHRIVVDAQNNNKQLFSDTNSVARNCGMYGDLVWSMYRRQFVFVDHLIHLSADLSVILSSRVVLQHSDLPRKKFKVV